MAYKDPEKQREFQRIWSRNKKLRWRNTAIDMLGGKCVKCGYNENRLALQVDHVEPILRKEKGSNQAIFREIATGKRTTGGLQLLCCNCHAIKTYEDRKKFSNYIH